MHSEIFKVKTPSLLIHMNIIHSVIDQIIKARVA